VADGRDGREVFLADGTKLSVVTGIDDHSRFCVCAQLVVRAKAKPVCDALVAALRRHGIPDQILTDNAKVFTGKHVSRPATVLFDRICHDNGIRHLLTAPYSPTTTGKVEDVPTGPATTRPKNSALLLNPPANPRRSKGVA
jgi:transposase InsO family protein